MKDNNNLYQELVEQINKNFDKESTDLISISFLSAVKENDKLIGYQAYSFSTGKDRSIPAKVSIIVNHIESVFSGIKLTEKTLDDLFHTVKLLYLDTQRREEACQKLRKS